MLCKYDLSFSCAFASLRSRPLLSSLALTNAVSDVAIFNYFPDSVYFYMLETFFRGCGSRRNILHLKSTTFAIASSHNNPNATHPDAFAPRAFDRPPHSHPKQHPTDRTTPTNPCRPALSIRRLEMYGKNLAHVPIARDIVPLLVQAVDDLLPNVPHLIRV